MQLTRRELMGSAGLGAAALAGARFGWPAPAWAADPQPLTSGWSFDQPLVRRAAQTSFQPIEQVLWSTLMRVDDKLGLPNETWYLWHSTHDYPILRLYVGPTARGPFKERAPCVLPTTRTYTITQPAPTPPYTFQLNPDHIQDPDIVWDPKNRLFLATPHSFRKDKQPAELVNKVGNFLDEVSLLMVSPEGLAWYYVETNFTTPFGDRWPGVLAYPGQPDYGFEAPNASTRGNAYYGRFLRDYRGNVVRTSAGEVVWYYRGLWDNCFHAALGATSSSDLLTWTKRPGGGAALCTPAGGRQFTLGSALRVNGYTYLVLSTVDEQTCENGNPADAVISHYLKRSDSPDAFSFSDGPGTFLFQHPDATVSTAASYVIDSVGQHHILVDAKYGTICSPGSTSCSEQDGVDMFTAVPT